MSLQPLVQTPPEQWGHTVPNLSLVTDRHRAALSRLKDAYIEKRPLTILTGQGKFEANHVISGFLNSVDKDEAVVRLTKPYNDALSGMREINRALGFDPKDLSLADLDNILKMFLGFQRKHRRRTILCVEQADLQGRWLLDQVRRLVELEIAGEFGLMTILSGRPDLNRDLSRSPLELIRKQAGKPITLAPFTLTETTEFLRQRVEATGKKDISQLFEFEAIRCLHDASEGVPDTVGMLCFKCLELANEEDTGTVTVETVGLAEKWLRPKPPVDETIRVVSLSEHNIADIATDLVPIETDMAPIETDMAPIETKSVEIPANVSQPKKGTKSDEKVTKLVAIRNSEIIHEFPLHQGRYMVGRASTCEISLPSTSVSRRHALIVSTSVDVRVLDLGSTNGTFVNCHRISKDTPLDVGDVIMLGDCRIEYVAQ